MDNASNLSEKLLHSAYKLKATDIHFYPTEQSIDIYFRIHGFRKLFKKIPKQTYDLLLAYYKFTSGMDIGSNRRPQNGTIRHECDYGSYSLRLSTLPTHSLESLAIRILPQKTYLAPEELLLFPFQLQKLRKWVSRKFGLILITGPTGSGKTTLIYSLIEDILKANSYQTITLEDPIEKNIDHILQVQVNEKAGITYQTGLKAALRHDPDLLVIGEIRDKQTAHFALEAALTGHLVISTLHAKDAVGTINRLLDMGISREDLEQFLIAVGAIQLIPIVIDNELTRRAAIMELLDGENLMNIIKGGGRLDKDFITFEHLRKKAYAYGFLSESLYKTLF